MHHKAVPFFVVNSGFIFLGKESEKVIYQLLTLPWIETNPYTIWKAFTKVGPV